MKVSLEDIRKAHVGIKDIIKRTDLDKSISASKQVGKEVYLKFENQQITGSFKLRGALNKIAHLTNEEKKRGVVASSAGNHAQGVAFSATRNQVRSVIVMPENAPLIKIQATKEYGAEVILHGEIYDHAYEHAKELEKKNGYTFVHPYEDPLVIAGQGTLGIEIFEQLADVDSIIIPVGGGGLISGIGTAIKALKPNCRIIGVQSDQVPNMERLFHHLPVLESGKRIKTIADGIAVKKPSQIMYDSFISKVVDDMVTVSDDEIAEAIVFLLERAKTVVEGSGAAGMAALMSRNLNLGQKTCVLLCGGNIDLNIIAKVIDKGLIRKGRLVELSVVVDDLPGNLNRISKIIADLGGNVLEVHHDRVSQGLYLRETKIDFVLETASAEHVEKLRQAIHQAGARII